MSGVADAAGLVIGAAATFAVTYPVTCYDCSLGENSGPCGGQTAGILCKTLIDTPAASKGLAALAAAVFGLGGTAAAHEIAKRFP